VGGVEGGTDALEKKVVFLREGLADCDEEDQDRFEQLGISGGW